MAKRRKIEEGDSMTTKSNIPTSCTQTETTVLAAPIDKVWSAFRNFGWDQISPGQLAKSEYVSGGEGTVGSVVKFTYKDGTVWSIRVTEFSERHHTLAYELLNAEPSHPATGVQGELKFVEVTTDNHTFVSWMTEYSNDADLTVISDQKYKKQEFFKDVKANI